MMTLKSLLGHVSNFLIAMAFMLFSSSLLASGAGHSHHEDMSAGAMAEDSDFGKPGLLANVVKTIEVSMGDDMRFKPDTINVKQGETIRFVIKNTGTTDHEMVLGTSEDIREHREMMKKMPGMVHADANSVRVQPGKSGEIIWNFDLAGAFEFACLIPGHSEAGMKGNITVNPSTP